ncbi:MAG: PH domain-containing protein, partial [Eubacterium sp.]|nr:PH domain-containing protein [Eubacterium sp.]
ELYKIKDVAVKQGIKDKVLGIGTIEIMSVDETTPMIILKQIKNPEYVKETIRNAVRNSKANLNIQYRQEI